MQDLVKFAFVVHQLIDGQVSSLVFSVFKLLLLLELFNLVMQLFLSCLRSRCLSLCFVVAYVFDWHLCVLENFHTNLIWNKDPDELQSFELLTEGGKFCLFLLLENFSYEITCSFSCLCSYFVQFLRRIRLTFLDFVPRIFNCLKDTDREKLKQ